jgi:hypothetical protein
MNAIRRIYATTLALVIALLFVQSKIINTDMTQDINIEEHKTYLVSKTDISPEINAEWDKEIWENTSEITLKNYMGERPVHFPHTRVKVRYDEENIFVIFNVSDKYVKAVEKKINGKVWQDSCVEFFFSPGPDTERGYFNFEANCKGVFLFKYHTDNLQTTGFVKQEDYEKIRISHSLERCAEEEIKEEVEWQLEFSIPFSILSNYMQVEQPGPGVSWRANFYKCADKTSHPHWLTWAFVDHPTPKFHLPEFSTFDF